MSCLDLIGPTMQSMLDCAKQALIDCDRPAGLVILSPGAAVSWDNCCDGGGQLWVRLLSMSPIGDSSRYNPCGVQALKANFAVGVLRCAHTIDDRGEFPTGEQITSDALGQTLDASILLNAMQCCFPEFTQAGVVGSWSPLGVDGGCVGGEWSFSSTLGVCGCD